ncbi:hypothetical protein CDL15_Pgr009766 [Punica granatum]|uniref:Uncharacterized protein n=1 Tax=Punica granatum TaxID=22663 RepID=A0A218WUU4_PUNGR|nr:hypothetical protein CDL15_Pgr009766 [Punica granatum]
MGLSNFPSAGDGLLPAVVVSTVFWVELLEGLLRSLLHVAPVSMQLEGACQSPLRPVQGPLRRRLIVGVGFFSISDKDAMV